MFHVKNSENVSPDKFESAVVTNWCLAFRSPATAKFRLATMSPMFFASLEAILEVQIERASSMEQSPS